MNVFRIVSAGIGLAVLVGCATSRPSGPGVPLAEIPTYPDPPPACDTSARVCVYSELRSAGHLFDALKEAGYDLLGADSFSARNPIPPDFIVDELTFKNWTQSYDGDLWLFTRITVLVRTPYRVSVGSGKPDLRSVNPRVFQAYARTNLGPRTAATVDDYCANEGVACRNLVKLGEFRQALTKQK